jgi:hypothetical protein
MIKIPEGATHVKFEDGNYVFEFPNEWVSPFNWRLAACPPNHTFEGKGVTLEEHGELMSESELLECCKKWIAGAVKSGTVRLVDDEINE